MGKVVLKLGADVSTDEIYPGRYMATVLPTETPAYCFADLTEFIARLKARSLPPGSVTRRVVGSSVAKSWFATYTSDFASLFNNVDLPALVYPTNATVGMRERLRCAR